MSEIEALQAELDRRRKIEEGEHANAELAKRSLSHFLRAAWPIVEPSTTLQWGFHLDAMCEHLSAVSRGQIRNLVITIPPGCTKSILVGVMWPAWTWANDPSVRWLCAANEGDLATRDSLSCRNVVQSDWYRKWFPHVQLVGDQNVKTWYQTSRTGHRLATTVNSRVTGKKGDILLVDDPNDAQKVESEADRKRIINWWKDAFYDRVNDFKTGRRVVIGQRTHKQDLQGFLIETGEFEELRIPEEFEPAKRTFTSIGWTDPREQEGELLRPDRFGEAQIAAARKRLGTAGYRAKHQQDPMDREGYRFKAKWLDRRWRWSEQDRDKITLEDERGLYEFKLKGAPLFATCDPASSSKRTADFTVFGIWACTPRGDLVWVDCIRKQVDIPDQPKILVEVYTKHQFRSIGIEAVASNQSMFQFAQRLHLNAKRLSPKGQDKLAHAQGAIILAESGGLWLPDQGQVPGFPLEEVVNELVSFTGSDADTNDDVVDCVAYACDMRQSVSAFGFGSSDVKPAFRDFSQPLGQDAARRAHQFGRKRGDAPVALPPTAVNRRRP